MFKGRGRGNLKRRREVDIVSKEDHDMTMSQVRGYPMQMTELAMKLER